MAGLKLSEWLGLTVADIRVSTDNDLNEQRAASNGQGIVRMLAYCEEILKENKRSLSPQNSVIGLFTSSSGIRLSSPVLLDTGDDDPDDTPAVRKEVSFPLIVIRF